MPRLTACVPILAVSGPAFELLCARRAGQHGQALAATGVSLAPILAVPEMVFGGLAAGARLAARMPVLAVTFPAFELLCARRTGQHGQALAAIGVSLAPILAVPEMVFGGLAAGARLAARMPVLAVALPAFELLCARRTGQHGQALAAIGGSLAPILAIPEMVFGGPAAGARLAACVPVLAVALPAFQPFGARRAGQKRQALAAFGITLAPVFAVSFVAFGRIFEFSCLGGPGQPKNKAHAKGSQDQLWQRFSILEHCFPHFVKGSVSRRL